MKSENRTGGRLAIERIAQRANAKEVVVRTRRGKRQRIPAVDFLIETTFVEAIKGDVKAHRKVVSWAKNYLSQPARRQPLTKRREITQSDVDAWSAAGFLPDGCKLDLASIGLTRLNKAYRASRKEERALPAKSVRRLRQILGQISRTANSDSNSVS